MRIRLLRVTLPPCLVSLILLCACASAGNTDPARERLETAVERGEYVFRLYFTSDYRIAEQEMLDYIRLLDTFSAESKDPLRNPAYIDAMLWYARLAKLEEQNGGAKKEEYLREATERCSRMQWWSECSADYLRIQVDRMDEIAKAHLN